MKRLSSPGGALAWPWLAVGLVVPVLAPSACAGDSNVQRVYDGVVTRDVVDDGVAADTYTPPPQTCTVDADCDDSRGCTVDRCDVAAASPHCVWEVVAATCFINNVCRASGEARPAAPCDHCDPVADPLRWTPIADGDPCDDHDTCTGATACQGGTCVGDQVLDCDDGVPCTVDRCDAALGCINESDNVSPCDDGQLCTRDDTCHRGVCIGVADGCDDGNPCTVDACREGGGCVHEAASGACEDGDPCTVGDVCHAGLCRSGGPNGCDDGNVCTVDTCNSDVGCVHLPTLSPCCIGVVAACDDGNPCTVDSCDALTGACALAPASGPCDDRDACTIADTCQASECAGRPRDCDDGDPCTADSCSPSAGCGYTPLTGPTCDDGLACSVGDSCVAGVCQGDTSDCVCQPVLGDDGAKLVTLAIGDGGYVGEALDLDGDPTTCAPASSCDSGINNSLGIVAAFANGPLADAVAAGDLSLVALFEPRGADPDAITLSFFSARLAPSTPGCATQTQTCDWLVSRDLLDPTTCAPMVSMPGTVAGNHLTAVGTAALPFQIRLSQTAVIEVTIAQLQVAGTVTRAGGRVTGIQGILAGAVPKQQLIDGIDALPDSSLPSNLDKATVLSLVNALVANDIDTNGDGVLDAASIGIKFTGIDAHIVGAQP